MKFSPQHSMHEFAKAGMRQRFVVENDQHRSHQIAHALEVSKLIISTNCMNSFC